MLYFGAAATLRIFLSQKIANTKKKTTFAVVFIARGVAQLVAHLVWDQGVASSSLVTPTYPYRRDGRVVYSSGLENRRTVTYRGFESLSLRKHGCKSASYAIYTLYYTPKSSS